MAKLLPCPFCGSTDVDPHEALGHTAGDRSRPFVQAGCADCGALGPQVRFDGSDTVGEDNKWNMRASTTINHERIYWQLHEEAFAFGCMAGNTPEQASRQAHIYAIQHTHQTYLEQFYG